MKAVNIAELKDRLSFYLNKVRAGHEVLVRDRNTPIARIVPITQSTGDDELQMLAAEGKLRLADNEMDESFWNLPAPRVPIPAVRRVLRAEREED